MPNPRKGNFAKLMMGISSIVRRWHILIENRLLIANLCLVLVTGYLITLGPVPRFGFSSELLLKLWGVLLQLVAVGVALWDIVSTGERYKIFLSTILQRNWKWFKRLVTGRTDAIASSGIATGTSSAFGGSARSRRPLAPNATTAERLEALEYNQRQIDAELNVVHQQIDTSTNNLCLKIDEAVSKLTTANEATEKDLRVAVVGNYSPLLFGTFWLLVGIVISSLAREIATRSFS